MHSILRIIKYNNRLYWRARKAQRGMGWINIIFSAIIAIAGPIFIAYSGLCMVPLTATLLALFFGKDTRIGRHSIDMQHLLPSPHSKGLYMLANMPFLLDLFDICTIMILPTLMAIAMVQPKLILIAICTTVINSLTMSYIMLWAKRKRIYPIAMPCYMLISQGMLLFAPLLLPLYTQIEKFAIRHWAALSLLSVSCAIGLYIIIIQLIKHIIDNRLFCSSEVMDKHRG